MTPSLYLHARETVWCSNTYTWARRKRACHMTYHVNPIKMILLVIGFVAISFRCDDRVSFGGEGGGGGGICPPLEASCPPLRVATNHIYYTCNFGKIYLNRLFCSLLIHKLSLASCSAREDTHLPSYTHRSRNIMYLPIDTCSYIRPWTVLFI